jgi:hypothetical protein
MHDIFSPRYGSSSGYHLGFFLLGGGCLIAFNTIFQSSTVFLSFVAGAICSGVSLSLLFAYLVINGYLAVCQNFMMLVNSLLTTKDIPQILKIIHQILVPHNVSSDQPPPLVPNAPKEVNPPIVRDNLFRPRRQKKDRRVPREEPFPRRSVDIPIHSCGPQGAKEPCEVASTPRVWGRECHAQF